MPDTSRDPNPRHSRELRRDKPRHGKVKPRKSEILIPEFHLTDNHNPMENFPQPNPALGTPDVPIPPLPHTSELFRDLPNPAESVGTPPNDAASFRMVPPTSAMFRKKTHTVTVREAARLFETAGVARTERSIVNWCQPNPLGIARLDAYFDPNERRWLLTPESIERAIAEERAKATRTNPTNAAPFGTQTPPNSEAPNPSASIPSETHAPKQSTPEQPPPSRPATNRTDNSGDTERDRELADLRNANFDLKITNRAKDFFIDQLQRERETLLRQVVDASQKLGRLESRLEHLLPTDSEDQSSEPYRPPQQ